MPDLSFVVIAAPHHFHLLDRAIASVEAQTEECEIVVVRDHDYRGAGWARNRGLEAVESSTVSFLDADDTVTETFAADLLAKMRPARYVFSNWFVGNTVVKAPRCPWREKHWHVLTTVAWTADVRAIGGFNEWLGAGEDSEYHVRLTRSGICGIHVDKPLFHYGPEGQRSAGFVGTVAHQLFERGVNDLYGGLPMACCGDAIYDETPIGEKQDGDLLAFPLWDGNRVQRGTASGRLYPRSSKATNAPLWVAEVDIHDAPYLWRPADAEPQYSAAERVGRALFPMLNRPQNLPPMPLPDLSAAPMPEEAEVDLERIQRKLVRRTA